MVCGAIPSVYPQTDLKGSAAISAVCVSYSFQTAHTSYTTPSDFGGLKENKLTEPGWLLGGRTHTSCPLCIFFNVKPMQFPRSQMVVVLLCGSEGAIPESQMSS